MIVRLMRRCVVLTVVAVLGSGGWGATAVAQVPRVISYQGALDTEEGSLPERVTLRFAFYAAQQPQPDEAPLAGWTETHTGVPIETGRVSVLLGSISELPDGLFDREDVYLEVRLDGDPMPRLRMASTPFARRAEVAHRVVPQGVDSEAIADGAVTGADLQDGAVVRAKLQERAVGTEQLENDAVGAEQIESGAISRNHLAPEAAVRSIQGPGDATVSGDLVLQEGGDVEIDIDEAEGVITISADGGWFGTQRSARRFKEDVEPLENPLALVEQLRGVRYRWKDSGAPDVGVIAEEVAEVLPELVAFEDDGQAQGVHYAKLTAVLIEALKAQQSAIDDAHARIDTLEDRLIRLEQRLSSGRHE